MQPLAALAFLSTGNPDTLLDRPLIGGPWGAAGVVGVLWFFHLSVPGLEDRQILSRGALSRMTDWERPLPGAPQPLEQASLLGCLQPHNFSLWTGSDVPGGAEAGGWTARRGGSLQCGERPGWFRGAGGGLQSSVCSLATSSFLIRGAAQEGPWGLAPNRDSSQKDGAWLRDLGGRQAEKHVFVRVGEISMGATESRRGSRARAGGVEGLRRAPGDTDA